MRFEFFVFKANRLMMNGRLADAERTLRGLLTSDLSIVEKEQVERMLDAVSNATVARSRAEAARMRNACRTLQLLLRQYDVEHNGYPAGFSLENMDFARGDIRGRLTNSLSAIEDYEMTDDGFSLIAVGRDGRIRMRVTQDGIDEEDMAPPPAEEE